MMIAAGNLTKKGRTNKLERDEDGRICHRESSFSHTAERDPKTKTKTPFSNDEKKKETIRNKRRTEDETKTKIDENKSNAYLSDLSRAT